MPVVSHTRISIYIASLCHASLANLAARLDLFEVFNQHYFKRQTGWPNPTIALLAR